MEEQQKDANTPSIQDVKGIVPEGQYSDEELESLDGMKVNVADQRVEPSETQYSTDGEKLPEGETRSTYKVVVETEPFTIPATGRETTHKEKFNMKQDKKGNWGVSLHDKSKSKKFFTKLGIGSFPEATGKGIVLVKKVGEKSGRAYLGFSI